MHRTKQIVLKEIQQAMPLDENILSRKKAALEEIAGNHAKVLDV